MNKNLFHHINLTYGRTALRLIRRQERCQQKLACYSNHLTFLTRCIKNRIIPRDVRIHPPVPTRGAQKAAELTSMRFLRERISLTMRAKADVKKEADSEDCSIRSTLSEEDAKSLLEQINANTQRVYNYIKERKETSKSISKTHVDKTNWVINLSSRTLLKKGLNFAITPTNIPATEIIATVESAIRPLNAEQADTVRRNVNSILQKAEPPKSNITKEMRNALKSLKEDTSIMILPADKGCASVILDTETYHSKMAKLTKTGPYQLLNAVLLNVYTIEPNAS